MGTQLFDSGDSAFEMTTLNGQTLPVFGNSLAKMPQHRDIELKNIRLVLPNLTNDQMKMLAIEKKLQMLREKKRRTER